MCRFTSCRKVRFQAKDLYLTFSLKLVLLPIIYTQRSGGIPTTPLTQATGPTSLRYLRASPLQGAPEEACFVLAPPPLPPWLWQSWEWQEASKPLHTAALYTWSRALVWERTSFKLIMCFSTLPKQAWFFNRDPQLQVRRDRMGTSLTSLCRFQSDCMPKHH